MVAVYCQPFSGAQLLSIIEIRIQDAAKAAAMIATINRNNAAMLSLNSPQLMLNSPAATHIFH